MITDLRRYIAGLDVLVPTLKGENPYINMDNAASTPPFKNVLETVTDAALIYSSVHRGNGPKSRLSTALYEQSREIVCKFVGANTHEHTVIFGKNTTDAINKVSYRLGLSKKDMVLISHLEHHSNDLPWRAQAKVVRIGLTPSGAIDQSNFMQLLRRYAGRIKLVAISGGSNVTGHLPDIHWFALHAHAAGAQILIDAAQLAAHRKIAMGALSEPDHIDYLALSGHKIYAPFGTGALIARRDTFEHGEPEYRGGGTISVVTPTSVDWAQPPDKDEAGSPNVIGAIALAKATQVLQHIGLDVIANHEASITKYALTRMQAIPNITVYGDTDPARTDTRSGVIPFTIQDIPSHLVAAILGYEWGIGVRSGCFCAQPYVMSLLGIKRNDVAHIRQQSLRGKRGSVPGMVRISFGLYTTHHEIDRLIEALQAIVRHNHQKYTLDDYTGFYSPANNKDSLKSFRNNFNLL